VSDVNLDRLRELAGHLRDAVRQLRELGQPRVIREDLGDLERYLTSVGRYLKAEI